MSVPEEGNLVGSVVGSFRIIRVIGRGGMGSVYLGEHTVIGSKVAIKVLHPKLAADENLVARFYAEARAVNLAGHENIVNIFDMTVVPPNRYCLVMEYLEGKQLNSLLTAAVPAEIAVPILIQVCEALTAAHGAGIVHRDLKPENIFLLKRGRRENFVKVLDFGLAKLLDGEMAAQQTQAGLLVGTPEFMSPEQANSLPVDGRADIYALGCIAWLLATGRLPFPQRGLTDLLVAHKQTQPEAPHKVNPSVPVSLSNAILKAMSKKAADRFQTADEFQDALEAVLDEIGRPRRPSSVAPPPPGAPVGEAAPRPQPSPAKPPPVAAAPAAAPSAVAPAPSAESTVRPPPPPLAVPAPRLEVRFDAIIASPEGKSWGRLQCKDISRGGLFVCASGHLPPTFTRVKVTLPDLQNLQLMGEVVRHVAPDQAKAWGMEPGFGMQFVDVTPTVREALNRIIAGLASNAAAPEVAAKALSGDVLNAPKPPSIKPATIVPPPPPAASDASVEKAIAMYRSRVNGDHYEILAVAPDSDFPQVKAGAKIAMKELDALRARPLTENQKAQVEASIARVKTAHDVLTSLQDRANYDANRSNFKGVGRCITAGLGVLDLERMRTAFLATHPGAAGSAQAKLLASKAHEGQHDYAMAIGACESALGHDPLNMQFHQRLAYLQKLAKGAL